MLFRSGLDFGLFNNRLTGTVEVFWKDCNNMLIDVTYPGILGKYIVVEKENVLQLLERVEAENLHLLN